jgi:radical SAM protein with 4Fe4S-binding SPASM domain
MDKFSLDSHKLVYHPQAVADIYNDKDVFPIYVEISPTAFCNHRCVFCHYHHLGHEGKFDKGRMMSLITELADCGTKSLVFAGIGEPLLNKETVPAMVAAKEQGIDVAMSTNGALMKEEQMEDIAKSLTWIRFSFNAATAADYAKIHKTKETDYELVLSNIKKLAETKKRINSDITIGIQYVILPETRNNIEELAKRLKENGADYFVIKHFYEHEQSEFSKESIILTEEDLNELKAYAKEISDDSFSMIVRSSDNLTQERAYDKCYGLPLIVYIRENGDVYTCFSYQHDEKTVLGNINDAPFKELWTSDKKKAAINYINEKIVKNKCQPNCRHHQINNFLWDIKHPTREHLNFI